MKQGGVCVAGEDAVLGSEAWAEICGQDGRSLATRSNSGLSPLTPSVRELGLAVCGMGKQRLCSRGLTVLGVCLEVLGRGLPEALQVQGWHPGGVGGRAECEVAWRMHTRGVGVVVALPEADCSGGSPRGGWEWGGTAGFFSEGGLWNETLKKESDAVFTPPVEK